MTSTPCADPTCGYCASGFLTWVPDPQGRAGSDAVGGCTDRGEDACRRPQRRRREAQDRVVELLDAVHGIPSARSRFHDYPSHFSGGMMQRALIVDALVTNPALLVADNVTQAARRHRGCAGNPADEGTDDLVFDTAVLFVSSSLPVAPRSMFADPGDGMRAGSSRSSRPRI